MNNHTLIKLVRGTFIGLLTFTIPALAVAQPTPKISYGVLLDSTGSMRSQFPIVTQIGKEIVHQTATHGPVSIFNFGSQGLGKDSRALPVARIEQSQDEQQLNRTIDGLYIQGGQTTLLDAIQLISDRLQEWAPDSQKVIVVVSDGEDRVSKVKTKDLIEQLKDRKIKVFAVGLTKELESGKRSKATKLLRTLTADTGGTLVLPESSQRDLQEILKQLALPTG